MRRGRSFLRLGSRLSGPIIAVVAATAAAGQEASLPAAPAEAAPQPVAPADRLPILTLDRERLFTGTRFGKATIAGFEASTRALQAENRRIDAALEAEERDLTDRRATTPPDQFRALAAEFDARVEKLRAAQDAKSRDLASQRDQARQRFYDIALPVLGQLMTDHGAVAIIDRAALILSFERIDVTDEAIARIDAALGDGPPAPAEPDGLSEAPAGPPPETVPDSAPAPAATPSP